MDQQDQEDQYLSNDFVNSTDSELTIKRLNLVARTNFQIMQENGQRRLTCSELLQNLVQRPKGAEVFLGHLPRDCYEDELEPYLSQIGKLFELRIMLDLSGSTRGYAFALFENSKVARRACQLLNNSEIRPGNPIGVVKSVDNCRLFFGGVPKDKTKNEFMEILSKFLNGITDIHLYPNNEDRSQNRGFIFVEFKDHRSAAVARRKLMLARVVLWDHQIVVDWADPEPGDPVDEEIMETVTALFVRNLPEELSQWKLKDMILRATNAPILKIKKLCHIAFVHYGRRDIAASVLNLLTQPDGLVDREGWEVCWAKPIRAVKSIERQRSIDEATAAGSRGNMERSSRTDKSSSSSRRKRFKGFIKSRSMSPKNKRFDIPKLNYAHILQKFVAENFQAYCHMEIVEASSPASGFVCKIIMTKSFQILYCYFGEPRPTYQKAVSVASRAFYHKLSTSPKMLSSTVDPPIPMPYQLCIYQPVSNFFQNEFCNPLNTMMYSNPTVYLCQMGGIHLEP